MFVLLILFILPISSFTASLSDSILFDSSSSSSSGYLKYRQIIQPNGVIFPQHGLQFQLYFTDLPQGVLFYSYDLVPHQTLVTFEKFGENDSLLLLSINKNQLKLKISMLKLCNTKNILNKDLILEFSRFKSAYFELTCNYYQTIRYNIEKEKSVDRTLPTNENPVNSTSNEVHLYIGQIPQIQFRDGNKGRYIYQTPHKFEGCIKSVKYNKTSIMDKLQPMGMKTQKCILNCFSNTCNGGHCASRISFRYPICQCDRTLKNGRFCNRELKLITQSDVFETDHVIHFNALKVSFIPYNNGPYNLVHLYTTLHNLKVSVTNDNRITVTTESTNKSCTFQTNANVSIGDAVILNLVRKTDGLEVEIIQEELGTTTRHLIGTELERLETKFSVNKCDKNSRYEGELDVVYESLSKTWYDINLIPSGIPLKLWKRKQKNHQTKFTKSPRRCSENDVYITLCLIIIMSVCVSSLICVMYLVKQMHNRRTRRSCRKPLSILNNP